MAGKYKFIEVGGGISDSWGNKESKKVGYSARYSINSKRKTNLKTLFIIG
jgi:hypothetical protein